MASLASEMLNQISNGLGVPVSSNLRKDRVETLPPREACGPCSGNLERGEKDQTGGVVGMGRVGNSFQIEMFCNCRTSWLASFLALINAPAPKPCGAPMFYSQARSRNDRLVPQRRRPVIAP